MSYILQNINIIQYERKLKGKVSSSANEAYTIYNITTQHIIFKSKFNIVRNDI